MAITLPVFAAMQPTVGAFSDVKRDAYFSDSIENLLRSGILKGYDDGRFGPHDSVTRGQVAVMLDRYDREEVAPLRKQLEEIRTQLKMGICSDGIVQTGEECDDSNIYSGDGCSATCQKERTEPPVVGTTYSGAKWECYDGSASKGGGDDSSICASSNDWWKRAEKYCSNHCGASGKCGVNSFAVTDACMTIEPFPHSSSSSASPVSCDTEKAKYTRVLEENLSCTTNSDCTTFVSACPFLTCGVAVNTAGEENLQAAADAYISCQENAGNPVSCAMCLRLPTPTCQQGRCIAQ